MDRSEAKRIRRERQRNRIEIVYLVLRCFSHYYMMRICVETAKCDDADYQLAETMANTFGKIFNMDIKPSDFMFDKDHSTNTALDEYANLNEILNYYFVGDRYPYSKKCIMAVLKYLYHNDIQLKMRHMFFLHYIKHVEMAYGTRVCGVDYLKEKSIEMQLWDKMRIKRVDTCIFRKEFIRIENVVDMIYKKRVNRKKKLKKKDK